MEKQDLKFVDNTALYYFENGTYLGKVIPSVQKVSVDGKEPQTLYAYNSNGYNYIRIRDLALLLSGTDKLLLNGVDTKIRKQYL